MNLQHKKKRKRRMHKVKETKKINNKVNKQQGSGIICPECGGFTRVRRTRPMPERGIQERQRICDVCGFKITTQEKIV